MRNEIKKTVNRNELDMAEAQARADHQKLARSLDEVRPVITGQVDSVVQSVDAKMVAARGKFDEGVAKVDQFVDRSRIQLDESFANADQMVSGLTRDFSSQLGQIQQVVGRVRDSVQDVITQVDSVAGKFEGLISDVRGDFTKSSDDIFSQAESITKSFRENFSHGATEIRRIMDRADRTIQDISNPAEFVRKNPSLGISALLLGGIAIGLFFRNMLTGEGHGIRGSESKTYDRAA